ncbi:MAG TPA: uracil-DNA glycosylase [Myxococcota bacterium]|nr:uracil-DNA glycosylase [Myxococcota bacterium]
MNDGKSQEAARLASALIAVLSSTQDLIPDLPVAGGSRRARVARTPGIAIQDEPAQAAPTPPRAGQTPAVQDADQFLKSLPDALGPLREAVAGCGRCRLASGRRHTVFGEGPANPMLMIVGESPGARDDELGRPFSGEPGELLTKIINAMGLDRERDCYLATVLKCRMPDESSPPPDLVGLCRPFLTRQVQIVKPRFLIAMGQTAAMVLAGSPSISRLRGRLLMHDDIPMLVTYHPSALLRDPALKKLVWEDVKLIMARMKT